MLDVKIYAINLAANSWLATSQKYYCAALPYSNVYVYADIIFT